MSLTVIAMGHLFCFVFEYLHTSDGNKDGQCQETPTYSPENSSFDAEHEFDIHTDTIYAIQPTEGERFQNYQYQSGERNAIVVYHV